MMLTKLFSKLFIAGLLLVSIEIWGKDFKIGIVDFQQVVEKSTVAQRMNKQIEDEFKPRQDGIIAKKTKLQEKMNELKRNQSIMKEFQIEQAQNEIASLNREIERESEDFQRDLQTAQAKASKQFTERVQVENTKIGENDQFDIILQKQATSYVNPKSTNVIDISEKLIRALSK